MLLVELADAGKPSASKLKSGDRMTSYMNSSCENFSDNDLVAWHASELSIARKHGLQNSKFQSSEIIGLCNIGVERLILC